MTRDAWFHARDGRRCYRRTTDQATPGASPVMHHRVQRFANNQIRNQRLAGGRPGTNDAVPRQESHQSKEVQMGLFTKDIKTMEDMFLHGLQDIYYAEHQITKALPKMIEKATNRDLAAGLKSHLEETNTQIERLQKVFQKLGKEPKSAECPAIDGLIKEADTITAEIDDNAVLDAAIVAGAQAVEHYEIARYGTLIAWAEELGHGDVVRFLTTNLNEEKAANTKLNTVALRKGVNRKAVA
jgi:ferritin-like metal-binding protein YciE